MFEIVSRLSTEKAVYTFPSELDRGIQDFNGPCRATITSFHVTPGTNFPRSSILTIWGTCHHVCPVVQSVTASVRTIGVPTSPIPPYMLLWLLLATVKCVGGGITLFDEDLVTDTTSHGVEVDPVFASELLYQCVLCEVFGRFVPDVVIQSEHGLSRAVNRRSAELVELSSWGVAPSVSNVYAKPLAR